MLRRWTRQALLLLNLEILFFNAIPCPATPTQDLYLKAYLKSKRGNHPAAITYFSELIKLQPGCVRAFKERACSYQKLGKYDKAISDLNAALALTPTDADIFCDRGVIYYITGKNEKAFSDFNSAIKLKGNDSRSRNWRANIQLGKRDFSKALEDCNAGIAADPEYVRIYRTRAEAYEGLGKHNEADKDRATYKSLARKEASHESLEAKSEQQRKRMQ